RVLGFCGMRPPRPVGVGGQDFIPNPSCPSCPSWIQKTPRLRVSAVRLCVDVRFAACAEPDKLVYYPGSVVYPWRLPIHSRSVPLSTAPRPGNLPVERSPLVGRAQEVAAAQALLLRAETGLVTFSGP